MSAEAGEHPLICPPLARGESQMSDYSDEIESEQLRAQVERDAERVFSILMRRGIKSHKLEVDDAQLSAILSVLDMGDREQPRSGKYLSKPHSAPASAVMDMRVHPVGQNNSLPFAVHRTHSDTMQPPMSSSFSSNRATQKRSVPVSYGSQRRAPLLRRLRRALRGLLRRHVLATQQDDAAATNGNRPESEAAPRSSNVPSSSYSGVHELRVPASVEKQHSSRSHELMTASVYSTGSTERQTVHRGLSHSEAATLQRSLAELGHDSANSHPASRERDKGKEKDRSRHSVIHRRFSKVLADIRAARAFRKAKRDGEQSSVTPPQVTMRRADSTSRKHGLRSLFSRTSRNDTVHEAELYEEVRSRDPGLADTISRYAEQLRGTEGNNNSDAIYETIGSLQRQRTRNDAVIESIANRVEQIVEGSTSSPQSPQSPQSSQSQQSPEMDKDNEKDKEKKKKKKQRKSLSPSALDRRAVDMDRAIDDALGGMCDEMNVLVKAWYSSTPARLRELDKDAREFLASSNYDLFENGMLRAQQSERHPHQHQHQHHQHHKCASTVPTSSQDSNSQKGSETAAHSRSHTAPPTPLLTSSPDRSNSDASAGVLTLLYLARRTADLGFQTVGALQNAKRNLMRYFCERYAQYLVENGGWSALVNADDDDCPCTPPGTENNSHPDID